MNKRVAIVLAVLNAALLAFILLAERGSLTTEDRAIDHMQVLGQFEQHELDRVVLERPEHPTITFERVPDEEGGLGTWRLIEPITAPVDDDAFDALMVELRWMSALRTLEGVSAEDRTRYGLDAPRYRMEFVLADRTIELSVGADAEGGVYVAIRDIDRVYVVGRSVLEALDHDANHFRDKAVFDRFYPADATAIRLVGEGAPLALEKTDEIWRVTGDEPGFANMALVDSLLGVTSDLRAERFVSDSPASLAPFGLETPWRTLEIDRPDEGAGISHAVLHVGAVCGEQINERYARAGDDAPVVCILMSTLSGLEIDRTQLRETRLLLVDDSAVERLVLLRGAREVLSIRRVEERFEVQEGEGEPSSADAEAVAAWLAQIRELRADRFEPLAQPLPHGLGAPSVTLRVERSDTEADVTIALGASDADGVWARRSDEPLAVHTSAGFNALLSVDASRFRDRTLVSRDAGDAREVVVTRGAVTERATRGDAATWQLVAPIETDADRLNLREITRAVASLRAVARVAPAPTPAHGLTPPSATVVVTFDADADDEGNDPPVEVVTVHLGAATVGGAYAQLGTDPAVVEIDREAMAFLSRPLVSLDLATLDATTLESVRIEGEGTPRALRRDGTRWLDAGGAVADPDATRALLDRLATLRAAGIDGYRDLEAPATTLTADPIGDGEPIVLRFGAAVGTGDEAYVPVQRVGTGVVYRFPRASLAPILD